MPKLAVLTAPGGPIELAEFPLTTPAPGTAALKLRMAGICGSDLHIFRGQLPLPCPFAMGHEMVCEVAELGEGLGWASTPPPSPGTAGAAEVIVIDKMAERLDVAAEFGATLCIDASGVSAFEVADQVRGRTDGMGADWVLEVVGVPEVIPDGVGLLNNGGTLLEVGNIGMGRTFQLDPSVLVYGNKSIRGVMMYDPVTLAVGLSFLQRTNFPFGRLMPEPFRLADVNAAYASADDGSVPRGALVP